MSSHSLHQQYSYLTELSLKTRGKKTNARVLSKDWKVGNAGISYKNENKGGIGGSNLSRYRISSIKTILFGSERPNFSDKTGDILKIGRWVLIVEYLLLRGKELAR